MHRTLYPVAGKRGRYSLGAASNYKKSASRLYVTDRIPMMRFLVGTGADLCLHLFPSSRKSDKD